jgi:outer membrane protein
MTMHNKRDSKRCAKPLVLTTALASALLTFGAHAQSLSELYDSARAFDATYQSAKLQYDANLARAEQARAGILPSAGVAAGVSRTGFQNSNPVTDRTFSTQNATLSASQPLYRPANLATYQQGLRQVDLAKAQLDVASQDLIVRTSQGYFDALAAGDTLAFVRAQKAAVAEQLASAKRNFEVGTSTITDTREAQARFDLVIAQEISAENDLRVKKLTLDTLVGKIGAEPKALLIPVNLPAIAPMDVNAWVLQSEAVHPNIRQAQNNLEIADLEIAKAEAGHKPTLDAVASYNVQRNPNGTAIALSTFRTNTTNIGLSFNLPLFAGFATQNRIRETLSLKDKAQSDLDGARRSVALATRSAFFGVQSGQGQVKALEAAELSSQSALDANKLGYQVGVRINIDVLNSQSQLFQTKRDLAQARYNVLLGGLRLRQANGTLAPEDLAVINSLLSR